MNHDIDIKKVRLIVFSKSIIKIMLSMHLGGVFNAKYLSDIQYIAKLMEMVLFHMGMRQTFSIPGIKYENIPSV